MKILLKTLIYFELLSQCLLGSGCLKDQENYDWTTAELISQLFIHFDCTQFVQEFSSNE